MQSWIFLSHLSKTSFDKVIISRIPHIEVIYAYLNNPQAEALDVNQSPPARRCTSGTKCCSKACGVWCAATARSDATALSRTTVSSTVAKDSSGGSRQCANSPPPTKLMKLPEKPNNSLFVYHCLSRVLQDDCRRNSVGSSRGILHAQISVLRSNTLKTRKCSSIKLEREYIRLWK